MRTLTTTVALLIGMADTKVEVSQGMQDQCLALAMSGGGSRGSYEAGAMWGMFYA